MMLGIQETVRSREDVVLRPTGTGKSSHPRVRSWADAYFESVLHDSKVLEGETFPVEGPEASCLRHRHHTAT